MSSNFSRSKSLVKRTKSFFGVDADYSFNEVDAWNQRRLKFCVSKFGNINFEKLKSNDFSLAINAGDTESVVANSDVVDSNYPLSTYSQSPLNLNSTICSRSTRGFLNSSVISPQTSVQIYGWHSNKKPHAIKAIRNTVYESITKEKSSANKSKLHERNISDDEDTQEEPINLQFQSLGKGSVIQVQVRDKLSQYCGQKRSASTRRSTFSKSYKLSESMIEKFKSGRRRFADSWMGRIICCVPKQSRDTKMIIKQIDDFPQYRPYFTYWVTLVQLIVFIVSTCVYGLAPIGIEFVHKDVDKVIVPSASIEQVCRVEYSNMFVGLRQADLIRLGARYSPCMRKDKNLHQSIIEDQRQRDRRSGCCIRNDGGGCYQTLEKMCSSTLALWTSRKKLFSSPKNVNVVSAVVCGLDPEFCEHPKSMAPFQWSEDFIKWPICQKQSTILSNHSLSSINGHMQCEISARPCCIGSKAECVVTTRQHCTFLRGYYHQDAVLCSQVNCLNEICGMLSFYDPDRPDQFYRLVTALFVNSSLGSLFVTFCVQLTIMRDLEKMAGWHRISILYILSGIVGNLCSGIFLPYQVQTGASGCLFGLLAMTFTEFLQSWKIVNQPWSVLFKFLGLGVFLFLLGFLPFYDNYAQMSGLVSGFILSFLLLPFLGMPNIKALQKLIANSINTAEAYKKYQQQVKRRRLFITIFCLVLWILLTGTCIVLFYWLPVTQCSFCKYFNCIPIAPHFCDNMDVNITTKTACVLKE